MSREVVSSLAQSTFRVAGSVVQKWFSVEDSETVNGGAVIDEIWTLLHGTTALYLGRSGAFDTQRAQESISKLLRGFLHARLRLAPTNTFIGCASQDVYAAFTIHLQKRH